MAEQLHEIVGYISALTYFVCSIISFISFLLFQFYPIVLIASIHLVAVIVAFIATAGMVYWWIMESRNPFSRDIKNLK